MKIGAKAARNAQRRAKLDRPPQLHDVAPKQDRSEKPPEKQMRHIEKRNNPYSFNPETLGADDLPYIQRCLETLWNSGEKTNGFPDQDIAAAITLLLYQCVYEARLSEFRLVVDRVEPINGLEYCVIDKAFLIKNPKKERTEILPPEIERVLIQTKDYCKIYFASRWAGYFNNWASRKTAGIDSREVYPFAGDTKKLLEAMTQVIQQFGHGVDRRYSLAKFRNIVPDFALSRLGLDPLNIALLTGTDSYFSDRAGYYYCVSQKIIQRTHIAIVNQLEGGSGEPDREIDKESDDEIFVGHGRCVTQDAMVSFVTRLKHGLNNKTGRGTLASIIDHHNRLTLYVSEHLRFVTSARDTSNPYTHILLSASGNLSVTVNDKNKKDFPHGRIVPVSDVATRLWDYYQSHLETLPRRLRAWQRTFGVKVEQYLHRKSRPPFFYLSRYRIIRSISRWPRYYLFGDVYIRFIPYIMRHYLRTMLSKQGVHWALIEAFLGHCISGRYAHSDFAEGMQSAIIDIVCPVIDDMACGLGWCAL